MTTPRPLPDTETRLGTVELRDDDGESRITGYAAIFNTLSENLGGFREQIRSGAFDSVLTNDVRALFNHDPSLILGRTTAGTLSLDSDGTGLRYRIEPPDTQAARDLIKSIQRGDVTQSSFAFQVDDDRWEEDDDGRLIRTIIAIKRLYDISPVTYPAYPDTTVASRSMDHFRSVAQKARIEGERERDHCRLRLIRSQIIAA
ncbi:MAG: HK97 family phage prohead protease [Candidatus Thiodiazotropha sp. 6PLUC6]